MYVFYIIDVLCINVCEQINVSTTLITRRKDMYYVKLSKLLYFTINGKKFFLQYRVIKDICFLCFFPTQYTLNLWFFTFDLFGFCKVYLYLHIHLFEKPPLYKNFRHNFGISTASYQFGQALKP